MIFLNRKRTITEQAPQKDPSKYWYIEKYVYGVLKETVEVELGKGKVFTAIESGYYDDWFYGWSISSTSTTMKFNNTTSYKNTTTSVKNNLDSNNTLKLYAVYKYGITTTKKISDSVVPTTTNGNGTTKTGQFIAEEDCTISVSGYSTITEQHYNSGNASGSPTIKYDSVTISIYDTYYDIKNSVILTKTGGTKNLDIELGDKIEYILDGYKYVPGSSTQGTGTGATKESHIAITSTEYLYNLSSSIKYRVTSHT